MNQFVTKMTPSVTTQIRMDHTHVMATFHRFKVETSPQTKQALVHTICLALEIHAQLEEEIFYRAMRAVAAADNSALDKSVTEHDEMKRLIAALRAMQATDEQYDRTVMELMRDVMHHVADEETILLPDAERLLGDRLHELGAQMARRRLELSAPHATELAMNQMRAFPGLSFMVAAGALLAGGYVVKRAFTRHG